MDVSESDVLQCVYGYLIISNHLQQGLRQDSEAATINELTDQSNRISC